MYEINLNELKNKSVNFSKNILVNYKSGKTEVFYDVIRVYYDDDTYYYGRNTKKQYICFEFTQNGMDIELDMNKVQKLEVYE